MSPALPPAPSGWQGLELGAGLPRPEKLENHHRRQPPLGRGKRTEDRQERGDHRSISQRRSFGDKMLYVVRKS